MKQNIVTRDRILILISGFFYFASPMLVTPLITGFSENLGASAALMGVIGGLMNICSLFCRPFVGNLTDKISKYKLSFIGAVLMAAASVGYAAAASNSGPIGRPGKCLPLLETRMKAVPRGPHTQRRS